MIPQYYDPAPYLDAIEHGREYLDARLVAVEAMLKTLREEARSLQSLSFLNDSGMIKEWEVARKGSNETYRP